MLCANCGRNNPAQAKFCCGCGAPVVVPLVHAREYGKGRNSPGIAKKNLNFFWPKIDTVTVAISAAKQGAAACFLVAAITGIIALIAHANRNEILGINGWSLLDASLFAVAGWRITRLSRPWAVAALALYLMEAALRLYQGATPGIVVMIFFIVALVNGVRGAFAYHSLCAEKMRRSGASPQIA
jgi:hypothetical protein